MKIKCTCGCQYCRYGEHCGGKFCTGNEVCNHETSDVVVEIVAYDSCPQSNADSESDEE